MHFFTQSGVAPAVDGIDFAIRPRETLGLVGESGSGKTMASLAVLRLVPPPARIVGGSLRFQGRDLLALDDAAMRGLRGKSIAMIFQNPAYSLNPILTIGDQLIEILRWHERISRAAARDRAAELLRLVGIADPLHRLRQFPHELSGGMKQRICIARALLCNPALILADEPTTNLDVTIQAQILDLLEELRERLHMAMLLVSHDMGLVARMAHRITVVYAGRTCETADARTHLSCAAASLYARAAGQRAARRPRLRARGAPRAADDRRPHPQPRRTAQRLPLPPALPGSDARNARGCVPNRCRWRLGISSVA